MDNIISINGDTLCRAVAFFGAALRVAVFFFVSLPFFINIEYINFMPWFVATMLSLAGVTNICPMVMFLKYIGMR